MTEPWMKELKRIMKFLHRDDDQSKNLWHVLTALRGPDEGSFDVKDATTAVLRHALGLRYDDNGAVTGPDSEFFAQERGRIFHEFTLPTSGHFRKHMRDAFNALNMGLYNVNDKSVFDFDKEKTNDQKS